MSNVYICSFSGNAAHLKPKERTIENLLACFAEDGSVSCFDMSEYKWLRVLISDAKKLGLITETIKPYPWLKYELTELGKDHVKNNQKRKGERMPGANNRRVQWQS